jgi:phosphatidate cytidylyltransferase
MINELNKRILTSLILLLLLGLAYLYSYALIIVLIITSMISWIEIKSLLSKILNKKKFFETIFKLLSLIYLLFFSVLIFKNMSDANTKLFTIYLFFVCINSDIGGLVFGKIFKGKKLTKISPKKTISGSLGSFFLSLFFVPVFHYIFEYSYHFIFLVFTTIAVSFFCQLGDLFISYLKRKAKVKDTGDILPGHGGILDRIDGMLFAVPIGLFALNFFY